MLNCIIHIFPPYIFKLNVKTACYFIIVFKLQNSRYVVTENLDEMYSVPLVTPNIDIEAATEVSLTYKF